MRVYINTYTKASYFDLVTSFFLFVLFFIFLHVVLLRDASTPPGL